MLCMILRRHVKFFVLLFPTYILFTETDWLIQQFNYQSKVYAVRKIFRVLMTGISTEGIFICSYVIASTRVKMKEGDSYIWVFCHYNRLSSILMLSVYGKLVQIISLFREIGMSTTPVYCFKIVLSTWIPCEQTYSRTHYHFTLLLPSYEVTWPRRLCLKFPVSMISQNLRRNNQRYFNHANEKGDTT